MRGCTYCFRLLSLCVAFIPFVICSCSFVTAKKAYHYGRVSARVVSVMPFNVLKNELQPRFDMNESMALNGAIDTTMVGDERVDDAFRLAVSAAIAAQATTTSKTIQSNESIPSGVAIPGTPSTSSSQSENDSASKPVASATLSKDNVLTIEKKTETKLTEPTLTSVSDLLKDLDSLATGLKPKQGEESGGASSAGNPAAKISHFYLYPAAAALFQDVKLLNHVVDFALRNKDYIPYVVTVQVAVDTKRNKVPVDMFATLSFFGKEALGGVERGCYDKCYKAIVYPMLASQSVESMSKNSTSNKMRQYAFALSAAAYAFKGEVAAQKIMQHYQNYIGNELNELFTVSSLAENTISVHFGATRKFDAQEKKLVDQQVSGTHLVNLLLLVPRVQSNESSPLGLAFDEMRLAVKSTFVDAETGRALTPAGDTVVMGEMARIGVKYGVKLSKMNSAIGDFDDAVSAVQSGDVAEYNKIYDKVIGDGSGLNRPFMKERVWMDLVEASSLYPYQVTSFFLPRGYRCPERKLGPSTVLLPLLDNGEKAYLTISGGVRADVRLEDIALAVPQGGGECCGRSINSPGSRDGGVTANCYKIRPLYVTTANHGNVQAVFPSVVKIFDTLKSLKSQDKMCLEVARRCDDAQTEGDLYRVVLVKQAKKADAKQQANKPSGGTKPSAAPLAPANQNTVNVFNCKDAPTDPENKPKTVLQESKFIPTP